MFSVEHASSTRSSCDGGGEEQQASNLVFKQLSCGISTVLASN